MWTPVHALHPHEATPCPSASSRQRPTDPAQQEEGGAMPAMPARREGLVM